MDERFTLLIEQMNDLKENAATVQKDMMTVFEQVKEAQVEISQKLDSIDKQISQRLDQFRSDGEALAKELSEKIDSKIAESNTAISDLDKTKTEAENAYQSKVDSLIGEISSKSSEIMSIYNELDKIKTKKAEYSEFLTKAEIEYKQSLESLKAEFEKATKNSEFPRIMELVEKLKPKVEHLEKHAHKHNFGGVKI